MLDILIKNGRYPDFAAGKLTPGDVGVKDGVIAALGDITEPAARVIDARGMIVSPGFIDIHMHEEDFDAEGEHYEISRKMLRMGVTTCLGGNCGVNYSSVARFKAGIEHMGGAPVNYMMLSGYNTLRHSVAGLGEYDAASSGQIEKIAAAVARDIEAGASGVSFGVEYDPGITEAEVVEAMRLQPRRDLFVSMHYRADSSASLASIEEMLRIARAVKMRFQISHLSSCSAMGQMRDALALLNPALEEIPLLDYDTYPYNAFCTTIGSAVFDNDAFLMWREMGADVLIASGAHKGLYCTNKAVFDQIRAAEPDVSTVVFAMREAEIAMAITNPRGMIGSDGGVHMGGGHPRSAGAFARVLSKYTREEGQLSMMLALSKLSQRPAKRLGLHTKGKIAVGCDADITVFDPAAVRDNATYDEPMACATGFAAVIVNGVLAVENDVACNERAGRFIQTLGR